MKTYLITVWLSLAAVWVQAGLGLPLLPGLPGDDQAQSVRDKGSLVTASSSTCSLKMIRS